jgi:hypothetical protein
MKAIPKYHIAYVAFAIFMAATVVAAIIMILYNLWTAK